MIPCTAVYPAKGSGCNKAAHLPFIQQDHVFNEGPFTNVQILRVHSHLPGGRPAQIREIGHQHIIWAAAFSACAVSRIHLARHFCVVSFTGNLQIGPIADYGCRVMVLVAVQLAGFELSTPDLQA